MSQTTGIWMWDVYKNVKNNLSAEAIIYWHTRRGGQNTAVRVIELPSTRCQCGDRIPVGERFSAPVQTGPGAHPASCTVGTRSFSGVESGRGVTLTPQPLLVPWSRKGRAIPLLSLWAVRPVQSLSACTRGHFTLTQCLYKGALYLTSVPVQGGNLPYLSACIRGHFTLPQCLYKGAIYLTSVPV